MTLDATVDKSSFPDAVPFAEVFVVLVVASCVPPLPMPIAENPYWTPCMVTPAIRPKATAAAASFAIFLPVLFLFPLF